MERVQYQLERSVPQLQLLDENNVFSKEQLRSITTQRQAFEGRLLRRGPDKNDFLRYADFERNLADLINVKANRIGLPRAFHRDNASLHTGHIIAIYERLVLKFKYDVEAWQQYIAFAKSRKMRVVTARVFARALSLHPNNVQLWLAAAAHELNDNSSTTAARSLLQRALRLNRLPWKKPSTEYLSSNKRASNSYATHSNKRIRHDSTSTQIDNDTSSTSATSGPAILKFSSRETDLLRLWVEYIRMELVFIERLRRRWLVLGLEWDAQGSDEDANIATHNESAEAQQAAVDIDSATRVANGTNANDGVDDQERMLLSQVPDNDVDAKFEVAEVGSATPNTFTPRQMTTIPPTQIAILRGNIPLFLIGSALESLAPRLHFVFLVALIELIQTFPFAEPISIDAPKSGQALRHRLLDGVYRHLSDRQRWGWTHFAPAALVSSIRSFRPKTLSYVDESDRTAAQVANMEEMDSHRLLTSASHLRTRFSNETDGLLELASQLRITSASGSQKVFTSSSSSLAVLLSLHLLQSLLTEKTNGGTIPSAAYQRLAESGLLPTAVGDAIAQLRALCAQAPTDATQRTTRSAKSEFYTTTALLIEMLSDERRSGIDEPNLLRYLESVQVQLIQEAQAAGPHIETAQMRAIPLRKKVDAAIALQGDKERTKKFAKLKDQLKDATSKDAFPASDELWSLRIFVSSQLAEVSGKPVAGNRDSIAAEWHRGLQACSENFDVEGAAMSAETSLWSRFLDWLDNGVVGPQNDSHKEIKAAFRYSSEQYRWAVRETASLLSRSTNKSIADLEALQQYRQAVHDLCVLRYIRLSRPLGYHDDSVAWLLQSSFASHQAWLDVISELQAHEEEQDDESLQAQKDAQLVDKIFTRLLQITSGDVEVWATYLQHLAARDMTAALKTLERSRSSLEKSEYKLVEEKWQNICEELHKASIANVDDEDEEDSE
ncbi:related to UTP6 - U3 snoRNP protein [Melanopsichium pennsylvanicum]|uniref:Related to UTP6 - U3 snoRNP protein n=2 Tax=Melanopsichium pennsylvanicum TaxID=63383 RepID=A0AAJ5C5U4_9BASI|nr:related to UTP6-U3 snoRNP protein [Melanopsichium pennsylvanicum 4]SNX85125.1 related to UTP6 - U3 snoRNP protein [Melanopsichium pennsylvanicum]